MAESPVSFLLNKTSIWLQQEKQLIGQLRHEVEYIQDELGHMKAFLRIADAKEENDPQLKEWVRQVREITYEVEDVLEQYMLRFARPGTNGFTGRIKKIYSSLKNLKARHQIASTIQRIKSGVEDVSRVQQRYRDMYTMVDHSSSSISTYNTWHDARADALLLEEEDVVGIEKPKEQLLEWIWSTDHELKVISVVGMGGLGKTTLVKKVYDDASIKMHFDHHVWITVSESFRLEHLLRNMIKRLIGEVKQMLPQGLDAMNADEMRELLYKFLQHKSYIIVLDDVWNIYAWEAIRYAFPKRGIDGCIIITTRFHSVANATCSEINGQVYNLKPLSPKESRELFYQKAFPRSSCPPYLRQISQNILKRCEGLPLAIIVIGGLLATKDNNIEEWQMFNRSLGDELEEDSLRTMTKLLSLSFYDLPYYLKSCFLYLSIFPEDDLLEKWRLIRLWIAEGFVQAKQGKTVEEVAEGYLNELLNKNLIRVVKTSIDGRPKKFSIHDVLRQFIISKSREHNILSNYNKGDISWQGKTRHLTIHSSINYTEESCNFRYLRSLHFLGSGDSEYSESILEKVFGGGCRLLKVLDLRRAPIETIPNQVFKLYHLTYLSLRKTKVKLIPKSIQNLLNLETLDLKESKVTELPIEILKLKKLRHLLVYSHKVLYYYVPFDNLQSFKAPYEIGNMSCITKLRREDGRDLCSSLAKLTNLRSLNISSIDESEDIDLQYSVSLPLLRKLVVHGCLTRVPQWVPSLNGLTALILRWSKLRDDPMQSLGDLPNLVILGMYCAYEGEELCFKAGGFEKLKKVWLVGLRQLRCVKVEKGCMPCLEEVSMWDCKLVDQVPHGMEHLVSLQYVEFCDMAEEFEAELADQKRKQGDGWKLAHVPRVRVFNLVDGAWKGRQL
ncbi:hypothetical protein BUALT_Bualt10G0070200 [Buddleja alternifolia]|uniref:Uncharacterized protein n=1 Tax=Buddleja alternifolia TaxID=168488 RepID=A0AAV6WXT8_9LAMI|nr:hypothetical protein BUALT_Bualt10G0070200 [Buddleja alternifolia]